jgi:TolA-binding protein
MVRPHKSLLSILSLFLLSLHPITHAESNGLHQDSNPLQIQIQQLQTQLKDANGKITVLETAMNTAHQEINAVRNCEACKLNFPTQSGTANTVIRRTANGHGR